jgi:glycosyltransferase involved in cell wall biosynthesis
MNEAVLIALPAFNEGDHIGSMVIRAKQFGQILVVDDGSSDDSVKVAEFVGAEVIRHEANKGYGATIKHILREASRKGCDVLVILDADGQHNAQEIPNLVSSILEGYDLVIGSRNQREIPKYRYVGQKILSFFTNSVSSGKIKDTQSGFRAFSRKAIESLQLKEDGMAISSEMSAEALRIGLRVKEVPVSVKYTNDGSTLNPIYQGGNTLTRIIVMISNRKPLLFFGGGGITAVLIGFFVGVTGYRMFTINSILPVGTMLASVSLLIIGILSIFTGIILNAVKK